VVLSADSYKHPKYGKIYNPVITVARWVEVPQEGDTPKTAAKKGASKVIPAPAKKAAKRA
jgi:hypothetical protein